MGGSRFSVNHPALRGFEAVILFRSVLVLQTHARKGRKMKAKKKKTKRDTVFNIIIVALFLICVSLLLYPYISGLFVSNAQKEVCVSHDNRTRELPEAEKKRLLADALSYNKELAEHPVGYSVEEALTDEYMSLLDLGSNGLMATLEIPCIELSLPVYHTVNEEILQIGVGHVQGSSLPVEGCDSNVMLMAHRGLPNSELFNNIDRLEAGDTFQIKVLDTVLDYRVGEIKTVKPDDVAKIGITKGKQLCTLVTCTPYGVNSDRLVVFAELTGSRRVANDTGGTGGYSYTLPFSRKGGPTIEEILALAGVLMLITAIAIEIYRLIKRRKTIE